MVFILTNSNWICTQIEAHIFRTTILRRHVGSSKYLEGPVVTECHLMKKFIHKGKKLGGVKGPLGPPCPPGSVGPVTQIAVSTIFHIGWSVRIAKQKIFSVYFLSFPCPKNFSKFFSSHWKNRNRRKSNLLP